MRFLIYRSAPRLPLLPFDLSRAANINWLGSLPCPAAAAALLPKEISLRKKTLFLSFSCVCPEAVLVK